MKLRIFAATLVSILMMSLSSGAWAQPAFSKNHSPETIGPGGISRLTFTILNDGPTTVTGLAFTDTLPAAVTIATPANATTDCLGPGGSGFATLSAPAGGTTVTFTDGSLGASGSCTAAVDVTSATIGTHMNTSGDLTSSAGNSGTAADDLTVSSTIPGFSKSFAPSSVGLGGTSTLTYLIDNTLNTSQVYLLQFDDTLPAGLEVASPAIASNSCSSGPYSGGVFNTTAGSSVISLDIGSSFNNNAAVAAGGTCTLTVDVAATGAGTIISTSGELTGVRFPANTSFDAGSASAILNVTFEPLNIAKQFLTNPVNAGGTTVLRFTIDNFSRDFPATGVAFSDDLTFLSGLTFTSLVSNDCGGTVTGVGGTSIGLSGGTIPAEGQCILQALLTVPVGATGDTYTNTTSAVTGTVDGSPVTGNVATDDLIIPSGGGAPVLTLDVPTLNPTSGGDITIEFTIQNTSTSSTASAVSALLDLIPPLPFPVGATLPPTPDPPCGPGSSLALIFLGTDDEGLELTGGSLAASDGLSGGPDTCTFSVDVTLPADFPGGIYTLTSDAPTATLDDVAGTPTVTGTGDSASFTVSGGANLTFSKSFDGTAAPGGTAELTFTITAAPESTAVTGLAFTDNLNAVISGMTGSLVSDDCGGTLTGGGTLSYTGGAVTGGNFCTIVVNVSVPASASSGTFTNTTSSLTGIALGEPVTFAAASADLVVAGLDFTKEFLTDPAIAGETSVLRFTIVNQSTSDATSISFTDNLGAMLPGIPDIEATGAPSVNTCGGTFTGTSFLSASGGSVLAGQTCTIEVETLVPLGAADGTYNNVTSSLTASFGGPLVAIPPATDTLTVQSALLLLSKEFTDDPVAPGDSTTLEFVLENSGAATASGVGFTDDLAAMLAGTSFTSVDFDDCGGSVSGTGTDTITVSGVSIGAGASCTIRTTITVPGGFVGGGYTNTTSVVFGTIGGFAVTGDPASDTLDVSTVGTTFVKEFDYPGTATEAQPGDAVTLRFTITNANPDPVTGLSFTDDLNAVLTGLQITSIPDPSPCGAGSSVSGTGFLTFSNGDAAATGGICTFEVEVTVPAAAVGGTYPNATSQLTSSGLFSASPATADLLVANEADISVTKTDGVTSAIPGESVTYTIVASNAGPTADPAVTLTDTIPSNLSCTYTSVAAGGATGNTAAGSGDISETLSMPSGSSVTYTADCDIAANAVGNLSNTANVTGSFDPDTGNNEAADNDTALQPTVDLSISKDDSVTSVEAGETVTYTIVAANAGPSTDPLVAIEDTFDSRTACTYTSVAAGGASGNTISGSNDISDIVSMPPGSSVSYTAMCLVGEGATGTLSNTATVTASAGVTETAPGDNSATDADTVIRPEADLSITKDDGQTSIDAGLDLTYTIVASNAGPSTDPAASITDTFPPQLTGCSFTATATGGATGFSASGAGNIDDTVAMPSGSTVTYSATCTVDPATPTTTLTNTAAIAASAGVTDPAPGNNSATDGNTTVSPTDLTFSKLFSPDSVELGQTTTLTFTINNDVNAVAATGLTFTDDMSAFGLVLTDTVPINSCTGGTLTAVSGTTTVELSGASVAANSTCEITVELRADLAGTHDNLTTDLISNQPPRPGATDTITVSTSETPTLTKTLSSTVVEEGEIVAMTLQIVNPNTFLAADPLQLTDDMTGTLRLTSAASGTAGCNGTVLGATDDEAVSFDGTVDAGATCTITVSLRVIASGDFTNTAALTSSLGDTSASVPVSVTPAPPLTFSMAFAPDSVEIAQSSTLTYTIRNTALIGATNISLADTLPAGLVVADPAVKSKTCVGGMVDANANSGTIGYAGGELDAGGICTISVDVTSATAAVYPNSTEAQASSLGASGPASATLTVVPATTGQLTIVQNTDTDGDFVFTSAEPGLNFTITTAGGTGSQGPITLPPGTYAISQTPPLGVGTSSIVCDDTDSTGDHLARTLSVTVSGMESVTCTLTSVGTQQKTVDTINRFLTKRADLILASEPRPGRRFDRLNRGFGNASRFTWSPGDLKAFLPFSAEFQAGSQDFRFSTSMLQVRQAAASVALAHGSTKNYKYVDNYRFDAWFEAQYKKFDTGAQGEGHFAIAYFGADYLLTPDMLVGIMMQIDDMEDLSAALNTSARGTGWMLGPYMTARLAPNLYFDGRIAAGKSTNEVSPFNTYTDEFSTDRWLAMASLTGDFQRGNWNIKPSASLSYFEETQASYVDSLNVVIPSQTVRLGQLKVGPTFTGSFVTDDGMLLAPYFGIDAIYNVGDTTGVTITNAGNAATEGWRGRLQAGLDMTTEKGTRISFGATYDGLFRDDYESWGLMFDITIPFSKPNVR